MTNKWLLTFVSALLIISSFACKRDKEMKNCDLKGTWRSVIFNTDKEVDLNDDGKFSTNLLDEEDCAETIFKFGSNGKVDRSSKNPGNGCKKESRTMSYSQEGDFLIFSVGGMKQKHRFEIIDCNLYIYGIRGSGKTRQGNRSFNINVILEKQ